MIVSALPPSPNDTMIDPALLIPTDYVVYQDDGRILRYGQEALAFVQEKIRNGEKVAFGKGHWDTHWVDTSPGAPVISLRPRMTKNFDKDEVMVRQEAMMPAVPPAVVLFTGPVSGSQDHPTLGDLKIGWTTPGKYQVVVSAFPYLDATFTLTVKSVVNLNLNANVKVAL